MYSLYRAWFGDGTAGDSYPRLQDTLSPPDTVIRVGNEGEHQFVAHKGVLAAHSGYLKALLASASVTSNSHVSSSFGSCNALPATALAVTASNASGQSSRQPVTSVSVSSIGGEAFAPLLNYMYTGRLEVTLDNVYSVLLATHLLHMPGALEQCRAALLRLRAPPPLPTPMPVPAPTPAVTSTSTSTSMSTSAPGSGNILRPIPNRLMVGPAMCWPPPTPLYAPAAPAPASIGIAHLPQLQPSALIQSAAPSSIPAIPVTSIHEPEAGVRYSVSSPKSSPPHLSRCRGSQAEPKSRSPEEVVSSVSQIPFVAAAAAAFSAFAASSATSMTRVSSPSQSMSPTPSSASQSPSPLHRSSRKSMDPRCGKSDRERDDSNLSNGQTKHCGTSTEETGSRNRESSVETISVTDNDRGRSGRRRNRAGSSNGNEGPSGNVISVVYDVACCDGPVRFHRVLNENYSSAALCGSIPVSRLQRGCMEGESASSENDENGGPAGSRQGCDSVESNTDTGSGAGTYTCGYCRHSFKSQYCYRKHAKRHLLPTRTNETVGNRQRQDNGRGRREVRLLDLNVQYYPCKICGCKFPSYYFVHKHRKLCHANAEERTAADATNSSTASDQESAASAMHEAP